MEFTTRLELHSQTTRLVEGALHRHSPSHLRDSHPPWRPVPRNIDLAVTQCYLYKLQLGRQRRQISNLSFCRFTRRYWGNPCWFLFLPLLICLSSGGILTWSEVKSKNKSVQLADTSPIASTRNYLLRLTRWTSIANRFKSCSYWVATCPKTKQLSLIDLLTLRQACPPEYQRAQCAFKDSMIHWNLQFTLLIAFRCVLHRCENLEIRCWKF